jgi:hypothetical protein
MESGFAGADMRPIEGVNTWKCSMQVLLILRGRMSIHVRVIALSKNLRTVKAGAVACLTSWRRVSTNNGIGSHSEFIMGSCGCTPTSRLFFCKPVDTDKISECNVISVLTIVVYAKLMLLSIFNRPPTELAGYLFSMHQQ